MPEALHGGRSELKYINPQSCSKPLDRTELDYCTACRAKKRGAAR